ncbi:MAG: ABC transporter permease [Chloroflexi bacterium]|nr:ABC transporter permease [Chloroflexota bacterium]MCY3938031.1 ABC transporter permease [Chloroflexota bacterium]
MTYLHALTTIFVLHFRGNANLWIVFGVSLSIVPLIAVITWITTQSPDSQPIAYISVGVILMAMWQTCVFFSGRSLASEFYEGTVDYTMVSRIPLRVVMLVKSVATLAIAIPSSLIAFATVQIVSRELIDVERPLFLLVSMLVAAWSITVVGYLFAPLFVLVQGRGGFFNAFQPLGIVLSGFLYPISQLSDEVQIVARLLPTSWAMDSVTRSIEPGESLVRIYADWGAALGVSVVMLAATLFMFSKVENTLRRNGNVGRF